MQKQYAGDFSLKEVKLYPVTLDNKGISDKFFDIKQLVKEISIYESIIATSLYCQLVVTDIGENLIGSLPLMGQERIQINISTSSEEYDLNFYIYKIDGRVMEEKNQAYVIHCVSIEALYNEQNRICEKIDGKKSHEYIKEKLSLASNFTKKNIDVDESLYPFNMYVPNWRLFDLSIWMARRSVSTAYKDSIGYMFYETLDGYKFKSLDNLFNQNPYPASNIKYSFVQGNTSAKRSELNNYRIINYSSPKAFDIFDDLRNGAFCHDSVYVDITNRTYRIFSTTADEYWSNMKHLDNLKPYRSEGPCKLLDYPSRLIYRPTTINTFGWKQVNTTEKNNIDEVNKNFEKSIYRYYFLEYNKLEISVPGDLKLRAGSVIQVSIPSPKRSADGKVLEDTRISGKYIVHSLRHTILNRTELRTVVTLTRDSFGGDTIPDASKQGGQRNL
jgi:hypothetical protein